MESIVFKGSFTNIIEDINITLLTEFAKLKYQEYLSSVCRKMGKFAGYNGCSGRGYHNDCIEYDTGYSLGVYLDFKHFKITIKEWQGSSLDGYLPGIYQSEIKGGI